MLNVPTEHPESLNVKSRRKGRRFLLQINHHPSKHICMIHYDIRLGSHLSLPNTCNDPCWPVGFGGMVGWLVGASRVWRFTCLPLLRALTFCLAHFRKKRLGQKGTWLMNVMIMIIKKLRDTEGSQPLTHRYQPLCLKCLDTYTVQRFFWEKEGELLSK